MVTRSTTESVRNDTTVRTPSAWLNQVRAFTERHLREVSRNRIMLFWTLGFPAGMYLLYTALGEGLSPTHRAIWGVAIGVFGAMFICLYVFGQHLVTDVEDQRYAAFRALPISPTADLAGRMLAGLILAYVAFLSVLVTSVLTGASYGLQGIASIPVILAAFVLSCVVWMIVALPLVVVAGSEKYAEFITTGIATGAFLITGLNGVVPSLFPADATLLNYLPNTLPTRMLVYHLVDVNQWSSVGVAPPTMPTGPEFIGLLFVYAVVFVAIGTVLTKNALYKRGEWL
jgi:ABC-2 type transport system permease protein